MDVDSILNETLAHEGGYVNNPQDPAGPTKYGITQGTLSAWLRHPASVEDVKNLTLDMAKEIYLTNYLFGPRINTLPEPIVPQTFDISVNSGPITAVKLVQQVINDAGFGPVGVDGIIGPICRSAATNAVNRMQGYFTNALVIEREKFYQMIVRRHPEEQVFLAGWIARAETFRVEIPDPTG